MLPQRTFKHHRVHCIIIRTNAIIQVYGTGSVQDSKPLLPFKTLVNTRNSLSFFFFFLSGNCMLLEPATVVTITAYHSTIYKLNSCVLAEI